jgi:hypothetical protein
LHFKIFISSPAKTPARNAKPGLLDEDADALSFQPSNSTNFYKDSTRQAQNTVRNEEFGLQSQNSSIIYKNLYDQDSEGSGDEKRNHL